eukprot:22774-Rhodomonas_salina.1
MVAPGGARDRNPLQTQVALAPRSALAVLALLRSVSAQDLEHLGIARLKEPPKAPDSESGEDRFSGSGRAAKCGVMRR